MYFGTTAFIDTNYDFDNISNIINLECNNFNNICKSIGVLNEASVLTEAMSISSIIEGIKKVIRTLREKLSEFFKKIQEKCSEVRKNMALKKLRDAEAKVKKLNESAIVVENGQDYKSDTTHIHLDFYVLSYQKTGENVRNINYDPTDITEDIKDHIEKMSSINQKILKEFNNHLGTLDKFASVISKGDKIKIVKAYEEFESWYKDYNKDNANSFIDISVEKGNVFHNLNIGKVTFDLDLEKAIIACKSYLLYANSFKDQVKQLSKTINQMHTQFLDKITDYKNENPETYNIFNRAANLFINKLKLIDEAVTEYSKDVVKTFDCALEAIDKCTNLINKKYEDKFNELNSPE